MTGPVDLLELLGIRGEQRRRLLDDLAEIARRRRHAIDETAFLPMG